MCNIILVDDDENQLILNRILLEEEKEFENISTFSCPQEAITYLLEHLDIHKDIVVIDINMPEMNAWEFLDNIDKGLDSHKKENLELFVSSFSVNPRDISRANQHKLVTKFIDKDILITELNAYVKSKKSRL